MGASGWAYFVPYQSSIEVALWELRRETLRTGHYDWETLKQARIDELEGALTQIETLFAGDTRTREAHRAAWSKELEDLKALPEPTDADEEIEQLLLLSGVNGTHSILDIREVSLQPEFGVTAPLSDQQLVEVFGSTMPSRAEVEAKQDLLMDMRPSWQGTHVIVYRDGKPAEICFAGCSGD